MIEVSGTITYLDGRVAAYTATQREFAAWERYALRSGLPTGTMGGAGAPLTMTRYLAYSAVIRGSDNPESYESWEAGVAEVSAESETAELDPTQAEQSAGS